jgi:hypothetical protein
MELNVCDLQSDVIEDIGSGVGIPVQNLGELWMKVE